MGEEMVAGEAGASTSALCPKVAAESMPEGWQHFAGAALSMEKSLAPRAALTQHGGIHCSAWAELNHDLGKRRERNHSHIRVSLRVHQAGKRRQNLWGLLPCLAKLPLNPDTGMKMLWCPPRHIPRQPQQE